MNRNDFASNKTTPVFYCAICNKGKGVCACSSETWMLQAGGYIESGTEIFVGGMPIGRVTEINGPVPRPQFPVTNLSNIRVRQLTDPRITETIEIQMSNVVIDTEAFLESVGLRDDSDPPDE